LNAVDYHFDKYEKKRQAAVLNELSEEEEDLFIFFPFVIILHI